MYEAFTMTVPKFLQACEEYTAKGLEVLPFDQISFLTLGFMVQDGASERRYEISSVDIQAHYRKPVHNGWKTETYTSFREFLEKGQAEGLEVAELFKQDVRAAIERGRQRRSEALAGTAQGT